jgi:hypothetical protein
MAFLFCNGEVWLCTVWKFMDYIGPKYQTSLSTRKLCGLHKIKQALAL